MADRRDPARPGPQHGRRASDKPHGTRARYKAHCRCTPCRAANAQYAAAYRDARRHGWMPFGSIVDAAITWRRIRQLTAEGFSQADIAAELGLSSRSLQWDRRRIRLRTALALQRFWRLRYAERTD